jgi:hypothetical protein
LNFPPNWWLAVLAAVLATILVGLLPVRGFWRYTLLAAAVFIGAFVAAAYLLNHYRIGM